MTSDPQKVRYRKLNFKNVPFNFHNFNNKAYDDPHAATKHDVNLSRILTKMSVDEAFHQDPTSLVQRKVDFFYLPYRKDLSISKGVPLSSNLSK